MMNTIDPLKIKKKRKISDRMIEFPKPSKTSNAQIKIESETEDESVFESESEVQSDIELYNYWQILSRLYAQSKIPFSIHSFNFSDDSSLFYSILPPENYLHSSLCEEMREVLKENPFY